MTLALLVALSGGCTGRQTATLKATPPTLPAPAFDRLPMTAGVWYPPDLAHQRNTGEWMVRRGDNDYLRINYDVEAGSIHLDVLRLVVNSAFDRVVELSIRPDGAISVPGIDLVVIPSLHRIGYGYGAEVEYALDLRSPGGQSIRRISATGTAPRNIAEEAWFGTAVRDAAAALLTKLATLGPESNAAEPAATRQGNSAFVVLPERLDIDNRIASCVADSLTGKLPGMKAIDPAVLRDQLYPWLEPSTKPYHSSDLAALLDRPVVRNRTAALDIRYVMHAGGGRLGGAYRDVTTCFGAMCFDMPTSKDLGTQISVAAFDLWSASADGTRPGQAGTAKIASAESRGSSFAIGAASCSEAAASLAASIIASRKLEQATISPPAR